MRLGIHVFLVALALFGFQLRADVFSCFSELPIPRYTYPPWHAQIQGTATVAFQIRDALQGSKPRFKITASHDALRILLEHSMSRAVPAACGSDEVVLVFQFIMRGPRVENPVHDIVFRSPNKFLITVTPPPIATEARLHRHQSAH